MEVLKASAVSTNGVIGAALTAVALHPGLIALAPARLLCAGVLRRRRLDIGTAGAAA